MDLIPEALWFSLSFKWSETNSKLSARLATKDDAHTY